MSTWQIILWTALPTVIGFGLLGLVLLALKIRRRTPPAGK